MLLAIILATVLMLVALLGGNLFAMSMESQPWEGFGEWDTITRMAFPTLELPYLLLPVKWQLIRAASGLGGFILLASGLLGSCYYICLAIFGG